MITGADDAIGASDDMGSAPAGWVMKTLFRDWGDTAGDGDGGFETAAIVVKNLGEGTDYPFDRKLSGKYVNANAKNMFALTVLANGGPAPGCYDVWLHRWTSIQTPMTWRLPRAVGEHGLRQRIPGRGPESGSQYR